MDGKTFNLAWGSITPALTAGLYLYGDVDVDEIYGDRIRPVDEGGATINIDTSSYFSDGPGRYANPARSAAIENCPRPVAKHQHCRNYVANRNGGENGGVAGRMSANKRGAARCTWSALVIQCRRTDLVD